MDGDRHIHRVTGLDAGLQYLYRISAVNEAGSSLTVQTSNPVMAFGMYLYNVLISPTATVNSNLFRLFE